MQYSVRVNLFGTAFVFACLLGVSIFASTVVVSRSIQNRSAEQARARREIDMRGTSRVRIRSDLAVWRVAITSQGNSLESAYESLEKSSAAVREFLKSQSFAPEEIGFSAISTRTLHARTKDGTELDDIAGYSLQRYAVVTTTNVEKAAAAAGAVTQLLRTGVRVTSDPPEFTFTKLGDIRQSLLGQAARDARSRADEVVTNTGGKVGAVREVRTSPIQITQPNSTDVSGLGRYDTSTIEKDVTAVVNVTFGIE
ncbi:MAG: SIMPL domain-containing protein [Phycisphaerales bacterium]|nr:SIMPL domain-containing protein [Planctomycetota bacterium]